MAKISQVSSKYIIKATIDINGVVDRPDVIGAIFGQTEGLLGADLELRELQRSGRIGRIEVNIDTKTGKSKGDILIPSSLDKAETAIVAAALEIIERIGPCNAKIQVQKIEDVRISKRQQVIERAKELLKEMVDGIMPDSMELAEEVSTAVRVMEVTHYGKEKIPCGPGIQDSDEIIIVEGRADIINLLKNGFKNCIAVGGTGVPPEVAELTKQKETTVFVDGDRGGDLIIKELIGVGEIDFITKAPDGKELEELTKKEIHKAIRSRLSLEQYELEVKDKGSDNRRGNQRSQQKRQGSFDRNKGPQQRSNDSKPMRSAPAPVSRKKNLTSKEKEKFQGMVEDLVGTRAALIVDDKMEILGKVPVSELQSTIKSLSSGINAVLFDGVIDKDIVSVSEKSNVKHLIGMDLKVKNADSKINLLTVSDL